MTNKLLSGGALAALAAALAFTAVPASAQDRHHDHDNNRSAHVDRGDRGSSSHRDEHTAPSRSNHDRGDQRTNTRAANQSHGEWSGRHEDQRAQATPQATSRRVPGWGTASPAPRSGDTRTYTDRSRNTTYVDRNRNTTYRSDNQRDWHSDRHDNDRTWASRNNNNQRWDRNWRSNNRYDWQRYRTYNRNVYHVGRYYSPYRNYDYRRLSIGYRLAPLFFSQNYWIGDPGYYRLPDVYGPYRWVRYYDDALLVDIYSGEVVDVIYDFFW
jgi:hypothetical protein